MNEEEETTTTSAEEGRITRLASLQNGRSLLDRIASMPPAPEPVLVEHRAKKGLETTDTTAAKPDGAGEADDSSVLHIDPEDYAHIKDHKGNPFDATIHKVTAEGKPDMNARGRVKMLKKGESNPIKLILKPFASLFPDPDSDGDLLESEREAQGAMILSDELMRLNAECIADMYVGTGFLAVGNKFTRGWEKGRRKKLVTALMHYDRQTQGGLMKAMPWMVLGHALATDCAMVAGGEIFDSGGGLVGWFKRLFKGRKRELIHSSPEAEGQADAA